MMPAPTASAVALLALMKLPGVGRRKALQVAEAAPRPHETSDEYRQAVLDRADRERLPRSALAESWSQAEEQLDRSLEAGIASYALWDEGYPTHLRTIPDPPAVLYVKGASDPLHHPRRVAVVGTREPTAYGETVAERSGRTAAERDFVVVSGLAHGVDTKAHLGCVDASGVGVAVLAHGLEKVYPAANRDLAARLLDLGGCLVSEYPLGMSPARTAFAERDRIQSGLSGAVFVIETDIKGGTMHTVRFARDQRRLLACVDHPEKWRNEDKTKGNQQLLRERVATPIADGEALVAFLDRVASLASEPPAAASAAVQPKFAF